MHDCIVTMCMTTSDANMFARSKRISWGSRLFVCLMASLIPFFFYVSFKINIIKSNRMSSVHKFRRKLIAKVNKQCENGQENFPCKFESIFRPCSFRMEKNHIIFIHQNVKVVNKHDCQSIEVL